MPNVRMPEGDQEAKWVPADNIESMGLDQHNLDTIRQGLAARRHSQAVSSARSSLN